MNAFLTRVTPEDHVSVIMKQLLQHSKLSGNALARELNFPPPTINRLVTGEVKDPRASTLTAIVDYFGITVDQLLGRESLPTSFSNSKAHETSQRPPMSIPVLNTTQALHHETDRMNPTDWLRWQPNGETTDNSQHVFAMPLKNDLYQPVFSKDTMLIVHPKISLESNDYVLVAFTGDTQGVIKKYVAEGRHKYLYPLSPDLKTLTFDSNDCRIIGVIIEACHRFR